MIDVKKLRKLKGIRIYLFWLDEETGDITDVTSRDDVIQVIRCKDCKFATITDGVYGRNPEVKYCDIWFPSVSEYMPIDYYCASAERKEE